jgi:hypothetical protein
MTTSRETTMKSLHKTLFIVAACFAVSAKCTLFNDDICTYTSDFSSASLSFEPNQELLVGTIPESRSQISFMLKSEANVHLKIVSHDGSVVLNYFNENDQEKNVVSTLNVDDMDIWNCVGDCSDKKMGAHLHGKQFLLTNDAQSETFEWFHIVKATYPLKVFIKNGNALFPFFFLSFFFLFTHARASTIHVRLLSSPLFRLLFLSPHTQEVNRGPLLALSLYGIAATLVKHAFLLSIVKCQDVCVAMMIPVGVIMMMTLPALTMMMTLPALTMMMTLPALTMMMTLEAVIMMTIQEAAITMITLPARMFTIVALLTPSLDIVKPTFVLLVIIMVIVMTHVVCARHLHQQLCRHETQVNNPRHIQPTCPPFRVHIPHIYLQALSQLIFPPHRQLTLHICRPYHRQDRHICRRHLLQGRPTHTNQLVTLYPFQPSTLFHHQPMCQTSLLLCPYLPLFQAQPLFPSHRPHCYLTHHPLMCQFLPPP